LGTEGGSLMSDVDRAILQINTSFPLDKPVRVAVYCRIGENRQNQVSDFDIQKYYYSEIIAKQSNWICSGLYVDEGFKCREQFNIMLADAKAGKFDLIISKSVSRFCRNTAESISIIRDLLGLKNPVGVYFETEGLNTLQPQAEFLLTILLTLAEVESEKRSKTAKLSWQTRKERDRK